MFTAYIFVSYIWFLKWVREKSEEREGHQALASISEYCGQGRRGWQQWEEARTKGTCLIVHISVIRSKNQQSQYGPLMFEDRDHFLPTFSQTSYLQIAPGECAQLPVSRLRDGLSFYFCVKN